MNTPPKIMVDTGIVSIGWADPACWEFVDDTICPLSNKLKIYRIRSRKASVEELIAVQAIGRAARNKEIALYEYSELRWESWNGYQSLVQSHSPLYAFQDVIWYSVPSPMERAHFFESDNWCKGSEVDRFMTFLLKTDSRSLHEYMCRDCNFSDFERQCASKISLFQLICNTLGVNKARDCYHLWACECNMLDFFITADTKFFNSYTNAIKQKKFYLNCTVIKPINFVELLNISREGITIPEPGKMFLANGLECTS